MTAAKPLAGKTSLITSSLCMQYSELHSIKVCNYARFVVKGTGTHANLNDRGDL
jgi:hypothetical protein